MGTHSTIPISDVRRFIKRPMLNEIGVSIYLEGSKLSVRPIFKDKCPRNMFYDTEIAQQGRVAPES